jgi:hypothetical protein
MIVRIFFLMFLCSQCSLAHAFTLNGNIANGQLTWDNIVLSHGQKTLSTWTAQSGLAPTNKWRPGFMASPQPLTDMVLSNGSNSVSFEIILVGVEYNTGGNNVDNTVGTSVAKPCDNNIVTGNVIQLVGSWDCSYNNIINYNSYKAPFFFLRPLFKVDDSNLVKRFEGKQEGLYRGTFPLTIRYFYYSATGSLTYRDLRQTFSVQVYFKPSYISSVTLNGNGVLEPVYDRKAKTVSAKASFQVNAVGHFEKGMKMLLQQREYSLRSTTNSKKIPYSISCNGSACSDFELVRKGHLDKPSTILSPGNNKSSITYGLDILYSDVSANSIDSGSYTDNFSVLFESDF